MKFIYNKMLFEIILDLEMNTIFAQSISHKPPMKTDEDKNGMVFNYRDLVQFTAAIPLIAELPLGTKINLTTTKIPPLSFDEIVKNLCIDLDKRWNESAH